MYEGVRNPSVPFLRESPGIRLLNLTAETVFPDARLAVIVGRIDTSECEPMRTRRATQWGKFPTVFLCKTISDVMTRCVLQRLRVEPVPYSLPGAGGGARPTPNLAVILAMSPLGDSVEKVEIGMPTIFRSASAEAAHLQSNAAPSTLERRPLNGGLMMRSPK